MWELKDEEYHSLQIDSILFNYKFPGEDKKWSVVKINDPQSLKKDNKPAFNTTKISSYSLPNSMDLTLWGTLVYNHDGSRARIDIPRSKGVYEVNISFCGATGEDKKIHIIDIMVEGDSVL